MRIATTNALLHCQIDAVLHYVKRYLYRGKLDEKTETYIDEMVASLTGGRR